MELYDDVSHAINKLITRRYSTSFGLSSTLFGNEIRDDIYAIYGLVRIADEIVDTYRGPDMAVRLDELEAETYRCIESGYSVNPVVHAFGLSARHYDIHKDAIQAFFASMRMDTAPFKNAKANYITYIYGSAEAVGLMCLSVFVAGDEARYEELNKGARALGAAYQKINFLRDLASDSDELSRWYFPDSSYETFDNEAKKKVTDDIEHDLQVAKTDLARLPESSKTAVALSLEYYERLLTQLKAADANEIKQRRIRVPDSAKLWLYAKARVGRL